MIFEELKSVLKAIGVSREDMHRFKDDQVLIPCPLAEFFHASGKDTHPSLSIRFGTKKDWTVFYCWTCRNTGKIWELVDSYGHLKKDPAIVELAAKILVEDKPSLVTRLISVGEAFEDWDKFKPNKEVTLNPIVFKKFLPALLVDRAKNYLLKRNIPEKTTIKYDLRYDFNKDRIVFPVYNARNQLKGAVGRILENPGEKNSLPYYNYFGFSAGKTLGGLQNLNPINNKVILVEGYFDLLNIVEWANEVNTDVVCSWTANLTDYPGGQIDLISSLDKCIICMYDSDKAGDDGWNKIKNDLKSKNAFGVRRVRLPEGLDPGEVTKDQFMEALDKRALYPV